MEWTSPIYKLGGTAPNGRFCWSPLGLTLLLPGEVAVRSEELPLLSLLELEELEDDEEDDDDDDLSRELVLGGLGFLRIVRLPPRGVPDLDVITSLPNADPPPPSLPRVWVVAVGRVAALLWRDDKN